MFRGPVIDKNEKVGKKVEKMADAKRREGAELTKVEVGMLGAVGGEEINSKRYLIPELKNKNLTNKERSQIVAKATAKSAAAAEIRLEAAKAEVEVTKNRAEEAARVEAVETVLASKNHRIKDYQDSVNRGNGGGYKEQTESELDMNTPSCSKGAIPKKQGDRKVKAKADNLDNLTAEERKEMEEWEKVEEEVRVKEEKKAEEARVKAEEEAEIERNRKVAENQPMVYSYGERKAAEKWLTDRKLTWKIMPLPKSSNSRGNYNRGRGGNVGIGRGNRWQQ